MCCFTSVLVFSSCFSLHLLYQHVVIKNARKKARKLPNESLTQTQREPNTGPMRENVSILHYRLEENASLLGLFFSHFGTFEACNPCQNAKQTHSVIWALLSCRGSRLKYLNMVVTFELVCKEVVPHFVGISVSVLVLNCCFVQQVVLTEERPRQLTDKVSYLYLARKGYSQYVPIRYDGDGDIYLLSSRPPSKTYWSLCIMRNPYFRDGDWRK